MKYKILPIIALLAVMVGTIGTASAFNIALAINGTETNPLFLKNGQIVLVDLALTNIRPQDLNGNTAVVTSYVNCAGDPGCVISDINLSIMPGKDIVTITGTPKTIQTNSVRVIMNVPLSRKPGTQYSFFASGTALGNPPEPGLGSLTVELQGSNITGKKCKDLNVDGICGQGEPGLQGWTINLKDENNTIIDTTTTDASGNYKFSGVNGKGLRGTFIVEEVPQAGWTQTGPPSPGTYTVTIDTNDVTGLDFANNNDVPNTSLTKEANPTQSNTTPTTVKYTYKETNTGNVPLTNASVVDDGCSPVVYQSGDSNSNNILDPSETWVFTCDKTYTAPGTYTNTAIAHGFTPQGKDITYPEYPTERASATVIIITEGKPGKSIGWGDLGSSASFDYWIYSKFLPSGTMNFKDKVNKVEIKATKIDSIDTTCNELTCETWPKSGTIKGMADVTENGALIGNFAFTVNVEDKADPSHGQDTFSISVPGYMPSFMPSGYSMGDDVTFGNLKVIKTS